ncbi:MAG: hypothetical protein Q9157_008663 [Trypethelium eluteriae]
MDPEGALVVVADVDPDVELPVRLVVVDVEDVNAPAVVLDEVEPKPDGVKPEPKVSEVVDEVWRLVAEVVVEPRVKLDPPDVVLLSSDPGVDRENDLVIEELPVPSASDVEVVVVVVVCVVKAVDADDKAKVSCMEEPADVLDWTLMDSTLALDVLLELKAVVAALLIAKDKAFVDEFNARSVDVWPVALLTAKDKAFVDELSARNVEVGVVALLNAKERTLADEFEAKSVDVGVMFVDAAAAVAVIFVLDDTRKERAWVLVAVRLETPVAVAASAVVAPLEFPFSTEIVRIWPDEPVPVFSACPAVVVGLPVKTETVKIDPSWPYDVKFGDPVLRLEDPVLILEVPVCVLDNTLPNDDEEDDDEDKAALLRR